MEVQKDKFPELLKLERQCKLMMRTASWIADYPDADNFMQLLYGKNIGQNNNGCAKIPEYDKLYEQTTRMPPSDERDRLYHEMTRLIEVYAPWRLDVLTLPQHARLAARPRLQEAPDPALRNGRSSISAGPSPACRAQPAARRFLTEGPRWVPTSYDACGRCCRRCSA
jgi:hypothetical protein